MDHEQNARLSYQILLTTVEVALAGILFALLQMRIEVAHVWFLAAMGIFFCISLGASCEFKARNMDIWRIHIVELVKGTELWQAFKEAKYRWIPFGKFGFWGEFLFGHWFERVLVQIMLMGWLGVLWGFPSPFSARLCGILAFCGWIIYAFRIIELKGEIIPRLHRR